MAKKKQNTPKVPRTVKVPGIVALRTGKNNALRKMRGTSKKGY